MRNITKYTLIAAGVCIFAGTVFSAVGYLLGGTSEFWIDSSGIHTNGELLEEPVMAVLEKTVVNGVKSLDITASYNDIILADSEDDFYYLEYKVQKEAEEPYYNVEDGTLIFQPGQKTLVHTGYSINFFGITQGRKFQKGYVKIYIPKDRQMEQVTLKNSDGTIKSVSLKAKDVNVTAKYGSMTLYGIEADLVSLNSSDGSIRCGYVKAQNFITQNQYGSTSLDGVSADKLDMKSSDGSLTLNDVDVPHISLSNKYGGIVGDSIRTETLAVEQSDGSCSMTELTVRNGSFKNSYGSVSLELTGKEKDYNYDLKPSYGSIHFNDLKFSSGNGYQIDNGADQDIAAKVTDGSIRIVTQ